jgi:transcription elongation GreA/GreB family factor
MIDRQKILAAITKHLEDRLKTIGLAIDDMKLARDAESKSSAGDKYETGRSMVQIEMGKLNHTLNQIKKQKRALSLVMPDKKSVQVEYGSVIETNEGVYLLAVGMGAVRVGEQEIFCISEAAPIGQALSGRTPGEQIRFKGRDILIKSIA